MNEFPERLRKLREEITSLNNELERAQRDGAYERASEI